MEKGVIRLKQWALGRDLDDLLIEEFHDNPLAVYLRVYFKQHQTVTALYRVLLLAFFGFLLFVSFLIYNSLNNPLLPSWGHGLLFALDLALLWGMYKAASELKSYQRQSQMMLAGVYEQLRKDLNKLEQIKDESHLLASAQKLLQKKIRSLGEGGKFEDPAEHQGWDSVTCPKCRFKAELGAPTCPSCGHAWGEVTPC